MSKDTIDKVRSILERPISEEVRTISGDLPRFVANMEVVDPSGTVVYRATEGATVDSNLRDLFRGLNGVFHEKGAEEFEQRLQEAFPPSVRDFRLPLQPFLLTYLGADESKLVRLLRCCTQSVVAPFVIEMKKTMAPQFLTRDKSWRWQLSLSHGGALVRSVRDEQHMQDWFQIQWSAELALDAELRLREASMHVLDLKFHRDLHSRGDHRKATLKKLLHSFADEATLHRADRALWEHNPVSMTSSSNHLSRTNSLRGLSPDSTVGSPVLLPRSLAGSASTVGGDAAVQQESSPEPMGVMVELLENGLFSVTYRSGDRWEGDLDSEGRRHGRGSYYFREGDVFDGNYLHGVRTGRGILRKTDGSIYDGHWERGRPNGEGSWRWPNGDVYTGAFVDGEFDGIGRWENADGDYYTGQFHAGEFHGRGLYYGSSGSYDGDFVHNVRQGMGTYHFHQYNEKYVGEWINSCYHGKGTYYFANNSSISGVFKEGALVDSSAV